MDLNNENDYAKIFNQGYMLAKHEPHLYARLIKEIGNSEYLQTLKDGGREYEREKARESVRNIRETNDRYKDKDREREF